MISGGMTPLIFQGSQGATIKPFVPSTTRASQKASDKLTKQIKEDAFDSPTRRDGMIMAETGMTKHTNNENG